MSAPNPASSYDKVARKEAVTSSASPSAADRAGYRAFNNFVKATMIRNVIGTWTPENITKTSAAGGGASSSSSSSGGIAYLDLASGRGGDLAKILVPNKTQRVPVLMYTALDISSESINEARRRYEVMKAKTAPGCSVIIDVADVFQTNTIASSSEKSSPSVWRSHEALAARKYHIVSMQFALHYGCSSLKNLQDFLACVSSVLVDDGGWFVGTTVDGEALRRHLLLHTTTTTTTQLQRKEKDQKQEEATTTKTRTAAFSVTPVGIDTPEKEAKLTEMCTSSESFPIGVPYRFQLDELVDDVEYSIPWEVLKSEAAKVGLQPVDEMCKNLYSGWRSGYVPDERGIRPPLSDGDVSLVSFYISFAFRKAKS